MKLEYTGDCIECWLIACMDLFSVSHLLRMLVEEQETPGLLVLTSAVHTTPTAPTPCHFINSCILTKYDHLGESYASRVQCRNRAPPPCLTQQWAYFSGMEVTPS